MILKDARLFVASFVKGEYTPEEYAAFLKWLQDASIEELGIIAEEHEALFDQWSLPDVAPSAEWVRQLEQKLDHAEEQEKPVPIRRFDAGRVIKRRVWIAAASILLIITGGYFVYNYSSKAGASNSPAVALYSIFSVPRGKEPQVFTLADGSRIWLNAASTLKYPASFNGTDRTVELSGEGYFEVTGSAQRPFHVKIKGAEIEVLGTHFNVKAYEEESTSKTTLVDGAVKVTRGSKVLQLKPGEQVEIKYSEAEATMSLLKGIDTDIVTAWKSGDLDFKDEEVSSVLLAIARKFNLELQYPSGVPDYHVHYNGNFSHKSNILQILHQLESQNIHCTIDGNIIKVSH